LAIICEERRIFGYKAEFFVPFIALAGRLRARAKPQLLLCVSSALRAPCASAAAALPKGAAKTEKEVREGTKD
jgi:hypothetical protein